MLQGRFKLFVIIELFHSGCGNNFFLISKLYVKHNAVSYEDYKEINNVNKIELMWLRIGTGDGHL
jgi:hypothetical protein